MVKPKGKSRSKPETVFLQIYPILTSSLLSKAEFFNIKLNSHLRTFTPSNPNRYFRSVRCLSSALLLYSFWRLEMHKFPYCTKTSLDSFHSFTFVHQPQWVKLDLIVTVMLFGNYHLPENACQAGSFAMGMANLSLGALIKPVSVRSALRQKEQTC